MRTKYPPGESPRIAELPRKTMARVFITLPEST
jgi:hypothetical protein